MPKKKRANPGPVPPEPPVTAAAPPVGVAEAQARPPRSVAWRGVYALIPVALACLTFVNTLWNDFATDDLSQILNNAFIKDLANIPKAFTTSVWAFVSSDIAFTADSYFRPLFSVLFALEYALFGTQAWGWHLVNILAHAAATWLVFVIIRRFTRQDWLALLTASLFAVHPTHAESVAWISGVTDPLLSLFFLPAFYFYLTWREGGRPWRLAAALGLFFLALLCKETALALPLIVAYCELFHFNRQLSLMRRVRAALTLAAWFALPALGYFLMRYNAINSLLFGGEPRSPAGMALATVPLATVKYLALMTVPAGYSYQHDTALAASFFSLRCLAPLALVAVVAAGVIVSRSPLLKFAAFWFAITLAPALAAIRSFDQEYVVQERYLYLPSIGFCLAVAMGLQWLASRRWVARRAAAAVVPAAGLILVWGAVCAMQNRVWKDTLTVYRHCVAHDPDLGAARITLSRACWDAGRPVEAEDEARQGVRLDPTNSYGYLSLSFYARQAGKRDKAIAYLEEGVAAVPEGPLTRQDLATVFLNLGLLYAEAGDHEKAEKNLLRSLDIAPRPVGWSYAGDFYLARGRYAEAQAMFERAAGRLPRWFAPIHARLGKAYDLAGQADKARVAYRKYLELAPPGAEERNEVTRRLAQL